MHTSASFPILRSERGFTLVELLVVIGLTAVLLMLSAGAVRHFWLVQALEGAADETVTQLRQLQARTTSESHPVVYGMRLRESTGEWGIVRFQPNGTGTSDDTCTELEKHIFGTGMFSASTVVQSASFPQTGSEIYEQTLCRSKLGNDARDRFVLFFARGNATPGRLTLVQPILGLTRVVDVTPITGRVTRS